MLHMQRSPSLTTEMIGWRTSAEIWSVAYGASIPRVRTMRAAILSLLEGSGASPGLKNPQDVRWGQVVRNLAFAVPPFLSGRAGASVSSATCAVRLGRVEGWVY